jgi:hypothetical protein
MAVFLSTQAAQRAKLRGMDNTLGSRKWIDSLVVVPSIELGNQVTQLLRQLYLSPDNENSEVQHIYRSNEEDEINQLAKLKKHTPSILVAQPTILLDFLCDQARELIPLHSLSNVIIEEADIFYKTHKKDRHNRPLSMLLNYLVEWRSKYIGRLGDGNSPYQNKPTTGESNQALTSSIDEKSLRLLISCSQESSVSFEPWLVNSSRPLIEIGSSNRVLTTNLIQVMDSHGGNLRPINITTVNPSGKIVPQEPLKANLADYIEGVGKVLAMTVQKKALVLVPPAVSIQWMISEFYKQGISAAAITSHAPQFHFRNGTGEIREIDHQTMFLSNDKPQILLMKETEIQGLNFPGLAKIILLTPHASSSVTSLLNLRFILRQHEDNRNGSIVILANTNGLDSLDSMTAAKLVEMANNVPKDCIVS